MTHKSRGFTLIEMLVALTLFSIIALSVASVFRSGVRTWRAGNVWSEENQAFRNLFRVLSRDLKNSVNYSPEMAFEGRESEMSFLTLLDSRAQDAKPIRSLARVAYRYDAQQKLLRRIVAGKEQGFSVQKEAGVAVVEAVDSARFSYAFKPVYDNENIRWKSEWDDDGNMPRGVRIHLNDFHTSVALPMGVLGDESALK